MVQDDYGFLWIGTLGGLNRYDGLDFKIYKHDDVDTTALTDNRINDLLIDGQRRLWVATYNDLHLFDYQNDSFLPVRPQKSDLATTDALSLIELPNGKLLVGTLHGIYQYDSASGSLVRPDFAGMEMINNRPIQKIMKAQDGKLWLGSDDGIYWVDEDKITNAPLGGVEIANVTDIVEGNGSLWISTRYNGLFEYTPTAAAPTVTHYKQNQANAYGLNSNNIFDLFLEGSHLWIGTETGGLNLLDLSEKLFYHYEKDIADVEALQSNSIWSVYRDLSGNMWVGSNNQGVFQCDPYAAKFEHVSPRGVEEVRLQFGTVTSFVDVGDDLWIGTDGGGISVWDRQENTFKTIDHHPHDPASLGSSEVIDLYKDSKGRVWVGLWNGGLNLFRPETDDFQVFLNRESDTTSIGSNMVFAIDEDRHGNLWMTTWGLGISQFKTETGQFFNIGYREFDDELLSSNLTYDIAIDNNGDIWVATLLGLDRVRLTDNYDFDITHFRLEFEPASGILSSVINDLFIDNSGRLWVGTDKGLNLYNEKQESFLGFTTTDGLPSNNIKSIIQDDENIFWVTTDNGIAKLNFERGRADVQSFSTFHGLQGKEFFLGATFKLSTGELFLGGVNGFNHFFPQDINKNPHAPSPQLVGFRLFNELVRPGDSDSPLTQTILTTKRLELEASQTVFSIDYKGVSFSNAEKNEYAFKLAGLESDWNYVGDRTVATYTNLDPGEYTFYVKSANYDQVWSQEHRALAITMLPPWWETWWARSLAVFFVVAVVLGYYGLRVRNFKRMQRALQKEVDRQTEELQRKNEAIELQSRDLQLANNELVELNNFKESMTGMVVHDLKNPLNVVLGLSEDKENPKMREINASGHVMREIVSNMLDVQRFETAAFDLKLRDIYLQTLVAAARKQVDYLLLSKDISVRLQLEEGVRVRVDAETAQRVFVNLLTNATKYSKSGSEIVVRSHRRDARCVVSVADYGKGIAATDLPHIFEKFWKGKPSKSSKIGSSGLGLAFCKMAVEAHSGKLEVKSTPGKGSVFTLDFQLGEDSLTAEPMPPVTKASLSLTEQDIALLSPLVVELLETPFHRASRIQQILEMIHDPSKNVSEWQYRVKKAVHDWDTGRFQKLMNLTSFKASSSK